MVWIKAVGRGYSTCHNSCHIPRPNWLPATAQSEFNAATYAIPQSLLCTPASLSVLFWLDECVSPNKNLCK